MFIFLCQENMYAATRETKLIINASLYPLST